MRRLILVLIGAMLLPAGAAQAQLFPPNAAGVTMGHLHYFVRDEAANRKFWIAFGATPVMLGTREVLRFPGVTVLLTKGEPTGNSEGSIVDHVGFLVPNVRETMSKMLNAGYKVQLSGSLTGKVGNVWAPEGERIELLEDQSINTKFAPDQGAYIAPPKMTVPITLHHIHIYAPPGAVDEAKAWYVKAFGMVPGKRYKTEDPPYEASDLPGVNMNFAPAHGPTVPTKGRALDHIGFEVRGLEAFTKKLEASGIKLDAPYRVLPIGIANAYFTDPWGTRIELTEGLNKL
jgi:catechol 2,3-dioxygenase-like lactoylglutathione lyase family enzyme